MSKCRIFVLIITNTKIPDAIYKEPYAYFRRRYIEEGNPTISFINVFKTGQKDLEAKKHLINVFITQSPDPKEILVGLTSLIYRYRNNLFHGEKDIMRLDEQRDNFIYANAFLSELTLFLKKELNIPTT